MNNTYIISLGGSLIVPGCGIDHVFLKKFKNLINAETKKGKKFYLIAGGGHTARQYIESANKITKISDEDKDWLGIHSTRLNAHLIRTVFWDTAHPEIIKNPTFHLHSTKKIVVAGGWKPGWSTDYVATMIAQEYEVDTIINLSNIEYAYDKDPKKFKNAVKIETSNWTDFREIVGDKWIPGLNMPFDPIASKKAQQLNLKVVIADGKNLSNLKNILNNKKYKGTTIS